MQDKEILQDMARKQIQQKKIENYDKLEQQLQQKLQQENNRKTMFKNIIITILIIIGVIIIVKIVWNKLNKVSEQYSQIKAHDLMEQKIKEYESQIKELKQITHQQAQELQQKTMIQQQTQITNGIDDQQYQEMQVKVDQPKRDQLQYDMEKMQREQKQEPKLYTQQNNAEGLL